MMHAIVLNVAAIVPCMMLLGLIVCVSRKYAPSLTFHDMILCFSLGVLSCIPLLLWELIFGYWEKSIYPNPVAFALYGACIMAAIPEELIRYLILRWRLSRSLPPVELMGCLLLGSFVGLGLGALEHIRYCNLEGWRACWERLFTAVLIHTMAGAIIGYFIGLAIIKRQVYWSIIGLSITILLHTIHNFLFAYLFEAPPEPEQMEIPQSSFVEMFYWPIRIFITLTYATVIVMLVQKSKQAKVQQPIV